MITKRNSVLSQKIKRRTRGNFASTSEIMGEMVEDTTSSSVSLKTAANRPKVVLPTVTIKSDKVEKAKKVIFTCITGNYDALAEPIRKYGKYDYICFTDNPNLTSTVWEIRKMPQDVMHLDQTRQQRMVKICPHKYLPEYDLSIWVDGNTSLDFDFDKYINTFVDDDNCVFVKKHPVRTCAYQERMTCERMKKDDPQVMKKQMDRYKKEGFPEKYGLPETNFMVRFHNDERCKKLMDTWANEVANGSKRDQLSFSYSVWKTKVKVKYFKANGMLTPKSHRKKPLASKEMVKRKDNNPIKLCVVNYNTNNLIEHLIKSINKFVPKYHLYIFDNSDTEKFETKDERITVFDNTKGQIINFDKFLEKYPNRLISFGKKNKWGSAKHAVSVEKCMDLINDNFILLDSDVLLKRDISNIYNDAYFYVADTITQPASQIKRILPFICFINVKKCKENGIHYFNDNYMHGLRKTVQGDRYDTGAYFYLSANKYSHFDINFNDYVEHMKGGSWQQQDMTQEQWLNKYKQYWQ